MRTFPVACGRVTGVHTNGRAGTPLAANSIGLANLQVIGQAFLMEFGYESVSNSSWKERFARRASGKARDLVPSGSPVILNLRVDPGAREVNSIAAIEALVWRHMPLLKAKRAIEAALSEGSNYLQVPKVEDAEALRSELEAAGLTARVAPLRGRAIDVKALRVRLGKSQEQFAARYRISLDVLQNWEQHRNEPDLIARNLLEMIERDPAGAERVLWGSE